MPSPAQEPESKPRRAGMRTSITESDSELKCDYLTTDDREQVLRTHWLTRHAPERIIFTRRLTYTYCLSRHSYSAI